jgi:hypothetical protein
VEKARLTSFRCYYWKVARDVMIASWRLSVGIASLLWAQTLLGATYYVATNGNDDMGNGSAANPWATPGYASKQLAPGDTLIVRGGTYILTNYYDDMIWTETSGNPTGWITICGEAGDRPVLLGTSNLSHAVHVGDRCYLHIANFEVASLRDTPYSGGLRCGVDGLGSYGQSNIVLEDLVIHHVEISGIALDGNISNVVIRNVHIHHTGYSCISGDYKEEWEPGWQDVLITNALLEYAGFYKDGVEEPSDWDRPDGVGFETSEGPVVIAQTTARYGLGDGLDSKARRTHIHHCAVANNYGDGVKLWGGGSVVENTVVMGTGYTVSNQATPWCLLVIASRDTNSSFEICHCTFFDSTNRANEHYAMTVQYDEADTPIQLSLRNNIIAGLDRCWLAERVELTAQNNLFWCRTDSVQVQHGTNYYDVFGLGRLGANNFYADPKFVLAEWGPGGDLHLAAASPGLDAGGFPSLPDDLEGKPRAVNGMPDLGAYEWEQYAMAVNSDEGGRRTLWCVASGAAFRAETAVSLKAGASWMAMGSTFTATSHIISVDFTSTEEQAKFLRLITVQP